MRRPLSSLLSVVCLLLAPAAFAEEEAASKKDQPASAKASAAAPKSEAPGAPVAVVVTARDPGANETAAAVEQALDKFIVLDGRLKPVDLLDALGGEPQRGAPRAEIADHFKKGKEAYDNLDLGAAATEYTEALKVMLEDPTIIQTPAIARALTLAGAAHLLNGDTAKAGSAFKRAVLICPDFVPDPNEFSPDILTAYNEAKQKVTTGPKGNLTVTSNVSPTIVIVDGSEAGVAPVTIKDLPAGKHHVLLKCRGNKPWSTFIDVEESGAGTATADLRPLEEADRFRKAVDIAATELAKPKPGFGAQEVASTLSARYLIFGVAQSASGGSAVEIVAYDLTSQRRAVGLKKTLLPGSPNFAGEVKGLAVQLVDALLKPGSVVADAEGPSAPITKRVWFWPVVGGVGAAVVAGAVAAVVLTLPRERHSGLVTTGIP